ncbi:TspO and MBR related proteins [Duganella sp. CF458]|uniref:TspO/MBR family protein n=1 Tax=Duganella sp. CF458 TaxID=1884368 RepID=UPI0008E00BF6|nr:TspO/MBR family protein [Duganella sp. CF458]SFF50678.1 TspO and MBR related proteins [Duganella sp. CF458]
MDTHKGFAPLALLASFAACFAAAALGALATADAQPFYDALQRPGWAPPAWLFGPVWTLLYAMMAIAAWIMWRKHALQADPALTAIFAMQLGLNALWSWIFFRWHSGLFAFIDILALIAAVAMVIIKFWARSRIASMLMWPYFSWLAFAAMLNWSLWRRNPFL